jgi:hypothetical protein
MAAELPDLIFRRTGRRAETLAAMIAFVGCLVLALAWNAPAYVYGPILLAIALLGLMLKRNPIFGMHLGPDVWTLYIDGAEKVVPLDRLASVRFTHWTDGAPTVSLHLRDGTEEDIPSLGLPPEDILSEALEARGVTVERA